MVQNFCTSKNLGAKNFSKRLWDRKFGENFFTQKFRKKSKKRQKKSWRQKIEHKKVEDKNRTHKKIERKENVKFEPEELARSSSPGPYATRTARRPLGAVNRKISMGTVGLAASGEPRSAYGGGTGCNRCKICNLYSGMIIFATSYSIFRGCPLCIFHMCSSPFAINSSKKYFGFQTLALLAVAIFFSTW